GSIFQSIGKNKEALDANLKAADIDRRLLAEDPTNTHWKGELAIQTGNAGGTMLRLGDTKGALDKFKEALTLYESLMASDPNDVTTRRNAGVGYRNVGTAIGTDNRPAALENFNKALKVFAGLAEKDPGNGDFRRQWAFTYLALSRFQVKADELTGAVQSAQQGIKIDEALVASSPTNVSAWNTLALLYRQLGDSDAALGAKGGKNSWSVAKDAYQKALNVYQDMKSKGTLSPADAGKPDELAKEIAKCDAVISRE